MQQARTLNPTIKGKDTWGGHWILLLPSTLRSHRVYVSPRWLSSSPLILMPFNIPFGSWTCHNHSKINTYKLTLETKLMISPGPPSLHLHTRSPLLRCGNVPFPFLPRPFISRVSACVQRVSNFLLQRATEPWAIPPCRQRPLEAQIPTLSITLSASHSIPYSSTPSNASTVATSNPH
jgi:hypothetical protein